MNQSRRDILRKVSALSALAVGASGIASAADCSGVSAWQSGVAYTGGDRVTYDGSLWEAKWWSRGTEPGSAGQGGPWNEVGPCTGSGGDGGGGDDGDGGGDGSDHGDDKFAPYEGTWGDLIGNTQAASTDRVIASFVGDATASDGVNPGWLTSAGQRPLTDFGDEIQTLQSQGYDVWVAIGGWHERTVARDASNPTEAKQGYEQILDTFGVTHIDIDDENAQGGRPDSVYQIRNEALAMLQEERSEVTVSYTVPAGRNGIENRNYSPARDMVSDAVDAGVDLSYVNIMTMGFSGDYPSIIASAGQGTVDWLANVYPGTSEQKRWEMLGVTPNIAESDFTTQDAQAVVDWAEQHDLGLLAFWALYKSSSVSQSEVFYQFEDDEN